MVNGGVWMLKPWAELSADEVYGLLALRQRVFVVEQACAYLDADGYDPLGWHIWSRGGDGAPVACARLFGPGVKFAEASLGRVASAPEARGMGLGRAVVGRALGAIAALHGLVPVRISAQQYLERFYTGFGFVTEGRAYLEDGVPHVGMVRAGA